MTDDKLEAYVRLYHKMLYRLSFSYVRNGSDAEDIVQDAFIKLMTYSGDFPTDEDCKQWLIRVTINLAKNMLKSFRVSRTSQLDEDIAQNPAENELVSLIQTLPPEYGTVIHLFYYEGYSVREIAGILKISETAVTSRLSRGRKRLKQLLTQEE